MLLSVRIHPMPTKTKTAAAENLTDFPEGSMADPSAEGADTAWEHDHDDEADDAASDPDSADDAAPEPPKRISGPELLEFYAQKKAAGLNHAQIAYAAGYYSVTKTGQERVMQAQFNEAYLAAQGIETGEPASSGRSHAGLSKARVSGQGILLVSQLATRHVGAEPGYVFEVSYPGDGQILLSPTGEIKPVVPRKGKPVEEPGTPLLDQAA